MANLETLETKDVSTNVELLNLQEKINDDSEKQYQNILNTLKETFPEIPRDLSDKKITILKGGHHINIIRNKYIFIDDGKGTMNGGILLSISKREDGTYKCTKDYGTKVIGKPNAVELHSDPIGRAEFQNAMSEFTDDSDSCRISIREIGKLDK